MQRLISSFLFVILLFAAMTSGQTSISADARNAANEAYQKKDWKAAASGYETIVKAEAKNAGALYRLGIALINLDRAKEAIAYLDSAMGVSPNPVFAFALARAHARNGEKEKMYAVFERSLTLGGISSESLNGENDFAPVKGEPKFVEYVKKLDAVANPCRARPEFRQFDFWIGEWAPQNPQGLTVGTSSIQLILNDCIIFENWNTPQGGGKSFSLWDARDGKWHQTWVDTRGGITHYTGGLEGDKMVLVAETINPTGQKSLMRMTYSKLPEGQVRQHGEGSADGGKTWSTVYDFKYVKAK
jgi:hypothetical protein